MKILNKNLLTEFVLCSIPDARTSTCLELESNLWLKFLWWIYIFQILYLPFRKLKNLFGQVEALLALAMGQNLNRSEQISYLLRSSAGRHLVTVRYCLRLNSWIVLNAYAVFITKVLKYFYPFDDKQRTQFVGVRQTFELTKKSFKKGHIVVTGILVSSRWHRSLLSLSTKALLTRFFFKSWRINSEAPVAPKLALRGVFRLSRLSVKSYSQTVKNIPHKSTLGDFLN